MKRATSIAFGAVAALALGLATSVVNAHPYGNGPGGGMGQGPGYGPGYGQGYGPGHGMGQGMGPGAMMGHGRMGYGPGAMGQGPMGQAPMGQGPMGQGPVGRGMGPQGLVNPSAMADARNAYFKSELNITPAQESAWKAYAEQRKQQVVAMQALRASAQGSAQATAPERLELRNQMMKKRQEQMEKGTTAFKELYAVLSPEQKALADQRVALRMMGGGGMGYNRPGR